MINDCNLLGLAYSHAALNTKFTGNYIKNKMHATVLTGYLVSFFEEHLYLNSQVKYGWVRLKNSGESKAHNKGTLFGIREELFYEIKLENGFAVAPLIGLAYDKIRLGKFRDQGSRDDVEVSSKRNHSLNGLIGVNIAKAIVKGGVNLVPSIHARLEHALDSKNKAMRIRALDMTADSALLPQKKISKTTFIVGAGVKLVTSGKLEIGVNYDIIRRGEFRSSNGSVKLRIIF
jgi:outer membrane autotransporter protein